MIFSRTMKEKDYDEMVPEGQVIQDIHAAIKMWYDAQHKARLWEYALAQKVLKEVFGDKKGLTVSDHGCGAGYMSPILYWLGHRVWMYECWTFGNEEAFAMEQMRRVGLHRASLGGTYEMRNRPLCNLVDADRGVDAAFCISTLEHIGEYQKAFRDLLSTVKPGGLVFLTTDFA
jgi:2-polyprenyl-3-methyl-5-hydroxy-6-metoxy-1,4-benzoquinol methylase